MDQNSIIFKTIQSIITPDDIKEALDATEYNDSSRKFTVTELMNLSRFRFA
jgi:hypothetical protein